MKSTRLDKIKKPTNAANPLTRVPEHRLVRQPTNNDKLSATFSRRYRCVSRFSLSEAVRRYHAIPLALRLFVHYGIVSGLPVIQEPADQIGEQEAGRPRRRGSHEQSCTTQ
jgi:hypothetical protein